MNEKMTHFDAEGKAIMVDVTQKGENVRTAIAKGRIRMSAEAFRAVAEGTASKGDVLGVARVAGIMGVKRTSDLIPMCHPLMISRCSIDFRQDAENCEIEALCTVSLTGKTGVEMEALTGVNIALLTIYDMCKAIDKRMQIGDIHLAKKTGGKSGVFIGDPEFEGDDENA